MQAAPTARSSPTRRCRSWHYAGGAYRIPHTSIEFLQIYTNTVPGGYFRAPGGHQYAFAVESHTDLHCRGAGHGSGRVPAQEHAERRRTGRRAARPYTASRRREVLEAALTARDGTRRRRDRTWDAASGLFGRQIGGGPAAAVLTAEADGGFTVPQPHLRRRYRHAHDRAADRGHRDGRGLERVARARSATRILRLSTRAHGRVA